MGREIKLFNRKIKIASFIPKFIFKVQHMLIPKVQPVFVHPKLNSFSQYQEDLIIDSLLICKSKGFYIDIGANDPDLLSNTKRFYLKGWSGINIEPNPNLYNKLLLNRPNDINLNYGVSSTRGKLTFYVMSADTLSSFDKNAAIESGKLHGATLVNEVTVNTLSLIDVFNNYVQGHVDFMSVDTEGYDLIVLNSNDWTKFRPYAVMVEVNQNDSEIVRFMEEKDYLLIFNNHTNGIFIDSRADACRTGADVAVCLD